MPCLQVKGRALAPQRLQLFRSRLQEAVDLSQTPDYVGAGRLLNVVLQSFKSAIDQNVTAHDSDYAKEVTDIKMDAASLI